MLDISIRQATTDDATAYHQFMGAIFAENLDGLIPPLASPDPLKNAFRHTMLHDGNRSALLFAEVQGELVGMTDFTRFERAEKDHTIGVGLYVGKEHRGQGIGRRLMEAGIAWASAKPDIERIELLVAENNLPAIRLYESLGFEHEGLKRCSVKKPHGYINVLLMALLMKQAAAVFAATVAR